MKRKKKRRTRRISKDQAMAYQGRPNRSEMPNGELTGFSPEPKEEVVQDEVRTLRRPRRKNRFWLKLFAWIVVIALIYLFFPSNINILVLGIDRSPEGTVVGRSDSIIYTQVQPLNSEVNLLSIPRDLWVEIPHYGADRINTAHYYAEAAVEGNGPALAIETVEVNFGLDVDHYIRIQLEKFPAVIDAFGGIELTLDETMGGLEAGTHTLSGDEALKFIRDREGTDDFFRMEQGQVFLKALIVNLASPGNWFRIPAVSSAFFEAVDTDIPRWKWGRIAFTFLLAGDEGITTHKIDRDMTIPIVTDAGANVLMPDWLQITPWLEEIFE